MLTDLDCANLCQALYDDKFDVFDKVFNTSGVDYAIKAYPDCAVICFEGSRYPLDWIRNFKVEMVQTPVGGVEKGFHIGLPDVLQNAIAYLPTDKPIYVIGHSLGAARSHIFAALLIKQGYEARNVIRVTFASPNPGDDALAQILAGSPCHSYRNYRNILEQDFVCTVPEPIPDVAPYMHPGNRIVIDVPAEPGDPWLFFARHHLFLYTSWIKEHSNG